MVASEALRWTVPNGVVVVPRRSVAGVLPVRNPVGRHPSPGVVAAPPAGRRRTAVMLAAAVVAGVLAPPSARQFPRFAAYHVRRRRPTSPPPPSLLLRRGVCRVPASVGGIAKRGKEERR